MSGRRLDLTQRQVRAICEGARKAGCAAVIQIGNTVVRLVPEEHVVQQTAGKDVDDDKGITL